ncbi:hypothetical protein GT755_19100 [Herbidospora sp. NEAU-GS84]|uniref:Uncharacterized protein n=1 Tax=Herbidospora solisilvae TaxID=2696284 RepID=A0A7C9N886_9ACTN|nr:hypothetical protein [Herbidospora solisilvae]NAS23793.1 hypothetical protein [Herbidospora solisilvae]
MPRVAVAISVILVMSGLGLYVLFWTDSRTPCEAAVEIVAQIQKIDPKSPNLVDTLNTIDGLVAGRLSDVSDRANPVLTADLTRLRTALRGVTAEDLSDPASEVRETMTNVLSCQNVGAFPAQ